MKIQNINTNFYNNDIYSSKSNFKSKFATKNIKNINIGSMPNGQIGQLEVMKADGTKALLNLIKSTCNDYEIYRLKDNAENVIGSIDLRFNKYLWKYNNEQDHLFVSELRNFSNPKTPYYTKKLEEHKHIGTILLQIALERSYENNCDGNIELIAKNRQEVFEFYKNLGFEQKKVFSIYENPNRFYLTENNKNLLKNKYDGLKIIL